MPYFLICAGLLSLMYVGLSLNVVRLRNAKRVSLGDGGDPDLLKAIRAHANFIEYVPLALILILVASSYYGQRTVAGLSVLLLVARLLHAAGILGGMKYGRPAGSILTALVLVVTSIWIILVGVGIRLY